MRALLVAALLACACSKTKISECEALVATAQQLQGCQAIPAAGRASIARGMASIKQALAALEDAAGKAPEEQLQSLAKTCRAQNDKIRELYAKVAPECLK